MKRTSMKKRMTAPLALCLALVMAFGLLPVQAQAAETSGPCGTNVYWAFDNGTLTISGTGSLISYSDNANKAWNSAGIANADITKIVIEEGVVGLGRAAFENCTNLQSVTIAKTVVSTGSYYTFRNCTSLASVNLQNGISEIGNSTFLGCTSLSSVVIPESVTKIDYSAFQDCTGLTSVTIPAGCTVMGSAFQNCESLTALEIGDGVKLGVDGPAPTTEHFKNCKELESVSIPASMMQNNSQAGQAFENCTKLKNITIADGAVKISDAMFRGCTNLQSITIPSSITSVAENAFAGCTSIESIFFSGKKPNGLTKFEDDTGASGLVIYYPYGDSTWSGIGSAGGPGTWTPVGNTTLTPTLDITISADGTKTTALVVTSSNLPFKDTVSPSDFTFENGYTLPEGEPEKFLYENNKYLSMTWVETTKSRSTTISEDVTKVTVDSAVFPAAILDIVLGKETKVSADVTIKTVSEDDTTPVIPPVDPTPTPTPTPSNRDDLGDDRDTTPTAEILPFPEVVPPPAPDPASPWQYLVKNEQTPIPWIERIDPPAYAKDLYDILVAGSDASAPYGPSYADLLISDAGFRLDGGVSGSAAAQVDGAENITFTLLDPYADISIEGLDSMIFATEDFYAVGAEGDQTVNYAGLNLGDVVKTANFNGVFVTKLTKGPNYDQEKKDVVACIATVFQAFDRDHPEVFWLSGKCRVRTVSVTAPDGAKTAYFFLVLADRDGFSMRSDAWTGGGSVEEGLRRRDAAVNRILASVTASTPYEQIRQLNRWLTEHNEYNTTADLTTIGNEPHECLSALEGRIGTNGPVCDGYSRAFKVLCNKLGISCVLENGYAKPTAQSGGTFHMWNSVQVGDRWYGMDVTWNDPTVKGVSGAISGKENENYLLVGASTEVRGMTFSTSHPATNQAVTAGVAFTNSPALSPIAYSAVSADAGPANPEKPFADVDSGAWYADAVYDVYHRALMSGTSATAFSPDANLSRQQIWMMLARLSGQRPAGMTAARAWAMDGGITDGSNPGSNVSRQQLATLLYRDAQARKLDVSAPADALAEIADAAQAAPYAEEALRWAVANGILTAAGGALSPEAPATRAQAAASFAQFCALYKL